MKRTREQLVTQLKSEGLSFSDFSLTHEGQYSASDADWNYKDVPHLHYVHELVEATIALVNDTEIATINMQKALGMKLPLAVFNYQSSPKTQTYFTTWLFFVLIVETGYEEIAPNHTQVRTTYSIGSSKWLRWMHPFIRRTITKNYDNLMTQDIPMRTRRGQLRSWGYSFRNPAPTPLYSFEETIDVSKSNVILPRQSPTNPPVALSLEKDLPNPSERLIGRDDHLGLRIVRTGDSIALYPRLCPHEGCSLDQRKLVNNRARCHWHGRLFGPLAILDAKKASETDLDHHHVVLTDQILTVSVKERAAAVAPTV